MIKTMNLSLFDTVNSVYCHFIYKPVTNFIKNPRGYGTGTNLSKRMI